MKFVIKITIFIIVFFETNSLTNRFIERYKNTTYQENLSALPKKIAERNFISNYTLIANYSKTNNLEFYSKEYYRMFSLRFFEAQTDCKNNRCNLPNGVCLNSTCKCLYGFVNSIDKKKTQFCDYKLKSQLWAFLLEAFTLIGGNIYLENYSYSIFKGSCIFLICLIFLLEMPCRICGLRDCMDYSCSPCVCLKTGTFVVCIFCLFIWETADLLKIMSYRTLDSNQMPLIYYF